MTFDSEYQRVQVKRSLRGLGWLASAFGVWDHIRLKVCPQSYCVLIDVQGLQKRIEEIY